MNQKLEITKKVLEILQLDSSDEKIKKIIPVWWQNPRRKEKGGLRLTDQGFEAFCRANIKFYEIKSEDPIIFTNQLSIWIDQNIDCPFHIKHKKIFVFGAKTAVQLVLFSGNIQKYFQAHKRYQEKIS